MKRQDASAAAACYQEDATFPNLAFDLQGRDDIRSMWRLICTRKGSIDFSHIRTEGDAVKARWIANYRFRCENPVHYAIDSTFTLRDGKILRQMDLGQTGPRTPDGHHSHPLPIDPPGEGPE